MSFLTRVYIVWLFFACTTACSVEKIKYIVFIPLEAWILYKLWTMDMSLYSNSSRVESRIHFHESYICVYSRNISFDKYAGALSKFLLILFDLFDRFVLQMKCSISSWNIRFRDSNLSCKSYVRSTDQIQFVWCFFNLKIQRNFTFDLRYSSASNIN